MSAWNLKELHSLIEAIHGEAQAQLASVHINTVARKLWHAGYHYQIATDAFSAVYADSDNDLIIVANTILSRGEKNRSYRYATLSHESNVIALAHVIHSLSDIFSHVIADSLKITGIEEDNTTLRVLLKNIPAAPLRDRVVRVLGLKNYDYLNAFVNSSKHIMLAASSYKVDMTESGKAPHGLHFSGFSYKGRKFTEKYCSVFLNELKSLSEEYVSLGREINMYLISYNKS